MRIHCLQNENCELARLIMFKRYFSLNELTKIADAFYDLFSDFLAHDKEASIYALFCATLQQLNEFQRLNVLANIFCEFNIEVRTLAQYKRKHELKTQNCYR